MKKEGLLKTLKNIEDTEKRQSKIELEAFKKLIFLNKLAAYAKKTLDEIKQIDKKINHTKLGYVHINGKILDISIFRRLGDFVTSIYFGDISVRQPINRQDEMKRLLRDLEYYKPLLPKKIQGNFSEGRNLIVIAFEESIFPLFKETPT